MGGYRTVDPETSKRAYEQIVADGTVSHRRREILSVLCEHFPLTAGEIGLRLHRNRNNIATRLSELEHLLVVEKVYEKTCPASGKSCWTWQMTGKQPTGELPKTETPSKKELDLAVREMRDIYRQKEFSENLIRVCAWLARKAKA